MKAKRLLAFLLSMALLATSCAVAASAVIYVQPPSPGDVFFDEIVVKRIGR